jgi:hypothetical protein
MDFSFKNKEFWMGAHGRRVEEDGKAPETEGSVAIGQRWKWKGSASTATSPAESCAQVKEPREGQALEIPLSKVGGVKLANLRSAVHRAAEVEKLAIETQSDEKNFYVWIAEKIWVARRI